MNYKNVIHVLSRAVIVDQGHILLCKTCDLAHNFYFLPGGHIEQGEAATNAVIREVLEESGYECTIKRFLGCLEHSFEPGHSSICHNHEYNFIFEVESLKLDAPIQKCEDHIELVWLPLPQIADIDLRPEPLKTLIPEWLTCQHQKILHSVMVPR